MQKIFTPQKSETPRQQKSNFRSNKDSPNGTLNGFIKPSLTSTPIGRECIYATPPKPRLFSTHKYSLSDIATPPRNFKKSGLYQGPLLASTSFNLNVSTYEDTKSPGLTSRIVQYNEEAEREKEVKKTPTHQAKYGSPGLFPIVHFFKQKLPALDQKPRKVTVKLASPDHLKRHSQEYNTLLLEGIIRPGSPSFGRHYAQPIKEASIPTRSVLDALKEISRKRIHTTEEQESDDETKRLRTEQTNGDSNNKRSRESPVLESPTNKKPISKRICVYDEYAASCSSMDFAFKKLEPSSVKRKSISISTSTENPKESKQVKLINAETQTVIEESDKSTNTNHETGIKDKTEETSPSPPEDEPDNPIKVFDDAPLERIRKNRLAALIGSLAGKQPILTPKPSLSSRLEGEPDTEEASPREKQLVSILSHTKSPHKSEKHVHFSIPEPTATSETTTEVVTKTRLETPAPPSSPVNLQPVVSSSSESVSSSFTKETLLPPPEPPKSSSFDFSVTKPVNSFTTSTAASSSVSPPKQGGFKFDLNKTTPTTTSNAVVSFNIAKPALFTSVPSQTSLGFSFSPTNSSTTTVFSQGTVLPTVKTSTTSKFGSISEETQSKLPVVTSFIPKVSSTTTVSSSTEKPSFSFGSLGNTEKKFGATSSFNFPITTTSSSSAFGGVSKISFPPSTTTATTSSGGFGSATLFGVASKPSGGGFGAVTTTTQSGFGIPVTTTTGFGIPVSTTSVFGSGKSLPAFGTPTTTTESSATFGKISLPSFGQITTTTQPLFGSGGGFGTATTTTAPSAFGAGTNTTSTFGSTNSSTFPSSNIFGVTKQNTQSFGSSFGNSTTQSPFASSTTITTAPSFAAGGNPPVFTFGAKTTSSAGFGTTSTSSFGNSSSFSSAFTSGSFGATAPAFAPKPFAFGSPEQTPGSFAPSFQKPAFGQQTTPAPTTQPAVFNFGSSVTPKPSGMFNFGTTTDTSKPFAFSATAAPSPAFGGAPGTFNIGSGPPTSSRARSQIKSKRRP